MTENPVALITGASSGMGAEFARQLATQGYHLILTARRTDRLEALAAELMQKHPIQVEPYPADLSDPAGVQALVAKIQATPNLDLLVNNAGFSIHDRFATGSLEKHLDMIQVHVLATVNLTRAALPAMRARRHGGIINVASVAAFFPAGNTTYTATKAYLVNFSQALQIELISSGIHVQALCPGFTITEFHDGVEFKNFRRSSIPTFAWLRAEKVVRDSLRDLRRGKVVCIPGWPYKLAVILIRLFLSGSLLQVAARVYRKRIR